VSGFQAEIHPGRAIMKRTLILAVGCGLFAQRLFPIRLIPIIHSTLHCCGLATMRVITTPPDRRDGRHRVSTQPPAVPPPTPRTPRPLDRAHPDRHARRELSDG